jgi:hypothetical protein
MVLRFQEAPNEAQNLPKKVLPLWDRHKACQTSIPPVKYTHLVHYVRTLLPVSFCSNRNISFEFSVEEGYQFCLSKKNPAQLHC